MASILEEIAEYAKKRTEAYKAEISPEKLKKAALELNADTGFPFEAALKKQGITFICECKKASPSKGLIAEDFPYVKIAKEYEEAGAGAVSVLTEPKWFLGRDEYLREIAESVSIPCLRKDFVVDDYMVYQAKCLGASAVLLICALHSMDDLKRRIALCHSLGLSALVEAHDEREVDMAVKAGARVLGVNNRNLHDFSIDLNNSRRLRALAPESVLFIAESGIRTHEDIAVLEGFGVDGVLIGETLMRSKDKAQMLSSLRGEEK